MRATHTSTLASIGWAGVQSRQSTCRETNQHSNAHKELWSVTDPFPLRNPPAQHEPYNHETKLLHGFLPEPRIRDEVSYMSIQRL